MAGGCARQDLIRCHRASDGTSLPTSSSLNYNAGQTVANMTVTPVGSDGYVDIHNGGRTPVSVMADLSGDVLQLWLNRHGDAEAGPPRRRNPLRRARGCQPP
jgi:hypothetical protein